MYKEKRFKKSEIRQYMKFAATGILNTAVDFGVLNALLFIFTPAIRGVTYAVFKMLSFSAAVTNSYLFNKYWVFAERGEPPPASTSKEKALFLGVSLFGLGINMAGSLMVFKTLGNADLFGGTMRANIGALAGTALTQISNFAGYKFLIFKRPKHYEQHISFGHSPGLPGGGANRINAAGPGSVLQEQELPVRDNRGE